MRLIILLAIQSTVGNMCKGMHTNLPRTVWISAGHLTRMSNDQFYLRWLNIKGRDAAFLILIKLFPNHLN